MFHDQLASNGRPKIRVSGIAQNYYYQANYAVRKTTEENRNDSKHANAARDRSRTEAIYFNYVQD